MGDSIVRKTDSTLNKDEDIVVCLKGAIIEHVTERVQRIMGREGMGREGMGREGMVVTQQLDAQ